MVQIMTQHTCSLVSLSSKKSHVHWRRLCHLYFLTQRQREYDRESLEHNKLTAYAYIHSSKKCRPMELLQKLA